MQHLFPQLHLGALNFSLFALRHWVTFLGPITAKILGNIENFDVGESHIFQCLKRRPNVRALLPGAAATINNNPPCVCDIRDTFLQRVNPHGMGGRTAIFRPRNMALSIKAFKTHLQQQRFLPGTLKNPGQRTGLHNLAWGPGVCSRKSARTDEQTEPSGDAKSNVTIV